MSSTFNASKVPDYIGLGAADMYWYERTARLLTDLYGAENLRLVANLMAATSINSSLKSNIRLFRKAYYQYTHDLPFSAYLPNIKQQLERLKAGQELSGRKIRSFAGAIAGDPHAVVVDIWLLRAFGLDKKYVRFTGPHAGKERSGGATDRQYNLVEQWVRQYAYGSQCEPRQISACIWSGVRQFHTGDRITRYDDVLLKQEFNMFTHSIFSSHAARTEDQAAFFIPNL